MKRIVLTVLMFLCTVSVAAAQTEGRVGVGASVSFLNTTSDEVDSVVTVGPLVRLNPRRGWGPAGGFSWFRADVQNPSGAGGDFARMRIRPVMAGVAYTVGTGRVLTSFSVVAGPSFNRLEFEDSFLNNLPQGAARPTIDIENSIAVRPGVNVTWTVARRAALVGFGGYVINRPDTVYRDSSGTEFQNRWKADALVVSAAVVYSIF